MTSYMQLVRSLLLSLHACVCVGGEGWVGGWVGGGGGGGGGGSCPIYAHILNSVPTCTYTPWITHRNGVGMFAK